MKTHRHPTHEKCPKLSKASASRLAFTLTEVLIVVAVIGLLCAILMPIFSNARDAARRTTCLSNLRQIGFAMDAYIGDNNRFYPSVAARATVYCTWTTSLASYVKTTQVFNCPAAPHEDFQAGCPPDKLVGSRTSHFDGGYIFNVPNAESTLSQVRIRTPTSMILLLDGFSGSTTHSGPGAATISHKRLIEMGVDFRHKSGANALFADGHTKWLSASTIAQRSLWSLSGDP